MKPLDDPFDECADLLEEVTKVLRSQAFTPQQQASAMFPALKVLRELRQRAYYLKDEHEQAEEVNGLKATVFRLCALLGLPSDSFVGGLQDKAHVDVVPILQTRLISLQRTELERRQHVTALVDSINVFRQELGEPPTTRMVERRAPGNGSGPPVTEDLSEAAVEAWEEQLRQTQRLRETRAKVAKQISQDIVALWKDDSRMPTLADPKLSDIERRILAFAAVGFRQVQQHIGLSSTSLDALIQKKQELVVFKEDRIRSTMEISKRLQLIDDRIVLMNLMRRVEAQAANPLRLFGDSRRLQLEDRFRRIAYPRLLLLEATLRPALVVYKERHQQPFRYKGIDYLEVMDGELKSRSVPRGVFNVRFEGLQLTKVSPEDAEACFGGTGDDGELYRFLSEPVVRALDADQPDFAKVLYLSGKVDDVMMARLAERSGQAVTWWQGALLTSAEKVVRSDEVKLLELGWQLPTTSPRPDVRSAATADLRKVIPKPVRGEQNTALHARYERKAAAASSASCAPPQSSADVGGLGRSSTTPGGVSPARRTGGSAPSEKKKLIPDLEPSRRRSQTFGPSGRAVASIGTAAASASGDEPLLTPSPQGPSTAAEVDAPTPRDASPTARGPYATVASRVCCRRVVDVRGPPVPKETVTEALVPRPPPVDVDPAPCDTPGHGRQGKGCGRVAARTGHHSTHPGSTSFPEPCQPRLLTAAELIPDRLPPAEVRHLRISATQVANMRKPRHVPLAQRPEFIAEEERRKRANAPAAKADRFAVATMTPVTRSPSNNNSKASRTPRGGKRSRSSSPRGGQRSPSSDAGPRLVVPTMPKAPPKESPNRVHGGSGGTISEEAVAAW